MLLQLPLHSRIWIYQADRNLNEYEVLEMQNVLNQFTSEWTAHTLQLAASAEVRYNRFVILGVDENVNAASGCSIDSSVRLIKQLEEKHAINFFDRLSIAYKNNEGGVSTFKLAEIKLHLANGTLNADTIIFNNMVSNLEELNADWELKLSESWLKKFLQNDLVN